MSWCVITGCALHGENGWAWGDLHAQGDQFIFNACLDERGETKWHQTQPRPVSKVLVLTSMEHYFERRGVIIVSKNDAEIHGA